MTNFRISHSDIKAITKCEYKWYYERHLELEPIEGMPIYMEVGTFGHSLMEAAFQTLLDGGTWEEAHAKVGETLLTGIDSKEKMAVYRNVLAFFEYFQAQPWKVVEVESIKHFEIKEGVDFAFTPDLVIEVTAGPLKGQLVIVDYKFTGQYWVDREIRMHQQVPKYIMFKNKHDGTNIKRGCIVMLNTRAAQTATAGSLFTTKWITPTTHFMKILERENAVLVDRIHFLDTFSEKMGTDRLKEILVHTADEKVCKMCWFADDLCPMEMNGKDVTKVLKYNYRLNQTYGYNMERREENGDQGSD